MKTPTIRFWLKPKTPFIDQCPQLGYKVEERHGHSYIDVKGNPFDATARELTFIPKDAVECVTFRSIISLPWWLPDGVFVYNYLGGNCDSGKIYVRRIATDKHRSWFRSPRYVAIWADVPTNYSNYSLLASLRGTYKNYRKLLRGDEITRESRAWTSSTEDFFNTLSMPDNPMACDGTPINDVVSAPRG